MSAPKETKSKKSEKTPALQTTVKQKAFDPVAEVITKYTENGWQALRAPKNSLNDVVAQKANRFHFVQVVTKDTIDDPKYNGTPKNNFIQNAFSNGAVPIFAHVVKTPCKDAVGSKIKITFENVNLNGRVIIGGKRSKESEKNQIE